MKTGLTTWNGSHGSSHTAMTTQDKASRRKKSWRCDMAMGTSRSPSAPCKMATSLRPRDPWRGHVCFSALFIGRWCPGDFLADAKKMDCGRHEPGPGAPANLPTPSLYVDWTLQQTFVSGNIYTGLYETQQRCELFCINWRAVQEPTHV